MGPEALRRQVVEGHQEEQDQDIEKSQRQAPQWRGQGDQDAERAEGQGSQQHGGQEPKTQGNEPPRGGDKQGHGKNGDKRRKCAVS